MILNILKVTNNQNWDLLSPGTSMFEITANKSEQLEEHQGGVCVCVCVWCKIASGWYLYTKGLEIECKLLGVIEEL